MVISWLVTGNKSVGTCSSSCPSGRFLWSAYCGLTWPEWHPQAPDPVLLFLSFLYVSAFASFMADDWALSHASHRENIMNQLVPVHPSILRFVFDFILPIRCGKLATSSPTVRRLRQQRGVGRWGRGLLSHTPAAIFPSPPIPRLICSFQSQ